MNFRNVRILLFGLLIFSQILLSITPIGKQNEDKFLKTFKREKTKLNFKFQDFHSSVKNLENYLIDNFRDRLKLINVYANLNYKIGSSTDSDQVIIGKEGWFFLGNGTNSIIDQHLGKDVISNKDLKKWNKKFSKVQRRLASKNKDFIVVITPNKHSVYPEYLPLGLQKAPLTTMDKVLSLDHLNILDLTPFLTELKNKSSNLVYYPTDSHWTEYGAYESYKLICEKLNVNPNHIFKIEDEEFSTKPYPPGYGLIRLIGLNIEDKKMLGFDMKRKLRRGIKYKDWSKESVWRNLPEDFGLKNDSKITVRNTKAPSKKKVLIVGDSFKIRLFDYLNNTFENVSYLHWIKPESTKLFQTIDKLDPDIVIYEVVERCLGDDTHLRGIPINPQ